MKLNLAHTHELPTGVLGLALAPDGARAFVTCTNGALYDLDLATGKSQKFESAHPSYASACVLLPDGKTVISGGYDGMLMWHDVETRRCWRRVQAHQFWNWQLALSPDGTRLATTTGQYLPGGWKYEPAAEAEPSVKIFDTKTGDLVAAFPNTPPVLSCAFTPDGRHVAAANMMGEVRIWELPRGTDLQSVRPATVPVAASNSPADSAPISSPNPAPDPARPVAQWTTPDFTSWGTIKTHHYCGGIYGLAFSPDGESLLLCGMGPMTDPMAGNGKMTWQRWDWRKSARLAQIKDNQQGSGLMEAIAWHPAGTHFVMAGKQAQGTWNAALFSAADGNLAHSIDTKKRITQARFTPDGKSLVITGAISQPSRKLGFWPAWGKVQVYGVES
jgi:WD40 repeat protein